MERWLFFSVILFPIIIGPVRSNSTICAYVQRGVVKEMPLSKADSDKGSDTNVNNNGNPEVLSDNQTVRCTKATDKCYALYTEDPQNKSNILILAQGCWETSGKCDQPECETDGKPSKAMNNTKFCCCAGNLCNLNIRDNDTPLLDETTTQTNLPTVEEKSYSKETVIIIMSFVAAVIIVMLTVLLIYRRWQATRKPSPDSMHLMEAPPPPPTPTLDLNKLQLGELVGRGRYGTVWRGTLFDTEVAVKVFNHQHRQYYLNERDIYTLPFMDHPCLMKFIGADEKPSGPDGLTQEYYIVMAHAPLGCLQDFLKNNVVDWASLCSMTQSIAKGLAYLHTDIRRGDKVKPCISHRDMNSRNVLVRVDLSCALCDMGFAMKIAGSKYYSQTGEEQHAETTSLIDVGTLRYMAPEVLEGAVNLRDCESSLKQIDVYALGLVLWEVASRCSDLYQGLEVPEYKLPFEAEIGLHPTFEQMQVLVSRHKARPLFPEVWKDSNLAVRLLKETIEDCWDQDAEARLTSLCVEERLQEIHTLWERHKVNVSVNGVSPTVNPTFPQLLSSRQTFCGGNGSIIGSNSTGSTVPDPPSGELTDRNANIMGKSVFADVNVLPGRDGMGCSSWQHNSQTRESSSLSENTVETTVTMSPDPVDVQQQQQQQPPPLQSNKNVINNQAFPRLSMPLQPHQGRNPCLERNMIMEPLEEVSISGNTLLEKGNRHKELLRNLDQTPVMEELFDALHFVDSMESNMLVNHDILSQSTRNCHPIPYVQNAVHGSLPVCPKQPNVPGNGHSTKSVVNQKKGGAFGGKLERKKAPNDFNGRRVKEWSGIRSLLDWTRLARSVGSGGEEDMKSAKGHVGNGMVAQRAMSDSMLNAEKSNTNHDSRKDITKQQQPDSTAHNHKVQTQVCLVNSGANTNCDLNHRAIVKVAPPFNGHIPNGCFKAAEIGVAKLHIQNGQAPIVVKTRSGSQTDGSESSRTEMSDRVHSPTAIGCKPRRPNTLSLKGHNFNRTYSSCKTKSSENGGNLSAASSGGGGGGASDGRRRRKQRLTTETEQKPRKVINCDRVRASTDEIHGDDDADDDDDDDENEDDESDDGSAKRKIEQRIKTPFQLKPGRFSLYDDRMMSSWTSGHTKDIQANNPKFSLSVPVDINSLCAVQAEDFLHEYRKFRQRENPAATSLDYLAGSTRSSPSGTNKCKSPPSSIRTRRTVAGAISESPKAIPCNTGSDSTTRSRDLKHLTTTSSSSSSSSSLSTAPNNTKLPCPSGSSSSGTNDIQGRFSSQSTVYQVSCI